MSSPLEKQPDFYRVLFEAANDAIFLADVETGRLLDANPRACELIGYTRDEIRGMHHLELHPPEKRERYQTIFQRHAETGQAIEEVEVLHRNGTRIPVEISASRITLDGRPTLIGIFRDLRPRYELEQVLQERESHYRILAEQDLIGVYLIQDNRFVYVNRYIANFLGYEHPEELIGRTIAELAYPEDLPLIEEQIRRRLSGEVKTVHYALRAYHRQGHVVDIEVIGSATTYRGRPAILGVMLHTSEVRRQARFYEAESRILQHLLRGTPQEALLDALCTALEQRLSDSTCTIQLLCEGRLYRGASHMPPEYDAAIEGLAIGPEVGSCGTAAFTRAPVWVADVHADPRWTPYRELAERFNFRACWSYPIQNARGEVLGTIAVYFPTVRAPEVAEKDVLARGAALATLILETQRLQAENARLAEVARQTSSGVVITDPERRVQWLNEGFTRLTGYTLKDVYGRRPMEFLAGPQTDQKTLETIEQCLREGLPVHTRIYFYRKDGTGFWDELRIEPLRDAEGRLIGLMGLNHDITELVKYEQELKRARAEAEAAARLKAAFLANMSHEIRTPLNSILGFAELLDEQLAVHALEPLREFTGIIQRSGRRLLRLINDILELSRLEAERLVLQTEPCALHTIVEEAVAELQPLAEQKNLALIVHTRQVPPVLGDPRRLHQIVTNLVANALKYTTQGEVRVDLQVETTDQSRRVVLRVTDTGPGIDPAFLPHLFEPFQRAPSEQDRSEGSGLGLAITKRLVEQMHGHITVDSAPGRGTTFTVTFPAL
ncbi:PAS domain S-box protein [Rhodothermus profundi]|uniref:histidine kinase n=1 Tax=Rhodothermus profundi TaxID=633813 RepID=A0A1M6RBL0_9BACT|nr:PAS domain S-box protein [Rhodothermus profundi]SHK29728.1 PAS domain S-box-containing protein [Rhodothermus profundi]